jgi:SAM-dependent methyltransferase
MANYGTYDLEPWLAELYDAVPAYVTRQDVDFYLERAHAAGGKVLELGCGTGRVLIPLARSGVEIVGLDLSGYMLARCRQKLAEEPPDVQDRVALVQASMADFDLNERFALITTPFRPFQHLLEVEEQLACLRCVRRHLVPDGRLILDLFNPHLAKLIDPRATEEKEEFSWVELPGGRRMRRAARVPATHTVKQYRECELIFYVEHPDGQVERLVQAFPFRYFFRYEVEHLLARSGLRVLEVLGDFDGAPLTDESPEMIFVAERAGESEA